MGNNFKTFILLAALTALVLGAGMVLGGRHGLMLGMVLAIGMNFAGYWFSDKIALAMSGAQETSPEQSPELFRVIQHLTQRAGLPMPRVYITPDWTPNAFATGRNPQHSAVAVTQGILQMLDRDELEGVLAHELAHIKNRDILISSVAAMLAGVLTQLAHVFQWGLMFGGNRDNDEEGPGLGAQLAMMVVAPIAASLVQMAVSRSREFEADRIGAQICGRPMSLANALLKLERGVEQHPMANANPATAHMYIVNPFAGMGSALFKLFSTHPPTEERVARLRALATGVSY
ncbi:zinc metalloprotease HtpX [bacterium]|nr:zinc metalloprotease HtpX [bacterium]